MTARHHIVFVDDDESELTTFRRLVPAALALTPGATARDLMVGTTPYVLLMIVLVALLFLVRDLALWLPKQMMGR